MHIDFSAGLDDVLLYSQGSKLLGGFYRAQGSGPRPTAILLHGVPGVEKNLDIAYELRDKGWNCLYFHYRGSWGSEGTYSFEGALEDVAVATEWVLARPEVDPHRLAVVGNSFGGYLALSATAVEPRYRATVSITPLVDPATATIPIELLDEFAAMLTGVTGAELKAQWKSLPPIHEIQADLDPRPMLLITGDRDELFPPPHYESLATELAELTWVRIANGDHLFSMHRKQLVKIAVDWLIENLGN